MKRKQKILLMSFMVLLLPLYLGGCTFATDAIKGDGNLVTETFEVDYFNSIDISGMFNVTLEPGNDLIVTLETDENLQEFVTIETRGDVLRVITDRESGLRPTRMDLHIIYPELEKLTLGGACQITSTHPLVSPAMVFDISGAASIDMELEVEELETIVAGAGSINLEGYAQSHSLDLSGASSLDAKNLITQNTDIEISGAGSASVHATQSLKARLSGIGSIKYYGDPEKTSFEKSGLGTIRRVE